jgi:dihydrofolate reductase
MGVDVEERGVSLTRIHNFSISLDGFATGEPQSAEAPFGHAGERLHEWMFGTRFWDSAGSAGVDNAFAERHSVGVGAEIMGANKFGPPGWRDDPSWKGWWGPNPPFHTPTFVLTHHPRPSIEMEGGTTFHFLDAAPADALAIAREAAGGHDVRIGGGPTVVRDFLAAGLVDHMHLVQVPIVLGRGVRVWDGLEACELTTATVPPTCFGRCTGTEILAKSVARRCHIRPIAMGIVWDPLVSHKGVGDRVASSSPGDGKNKSWEVKLVIGYPTDTFHGGVLGYRVDQYDVSPLPRIHIGVSQIFPVISSC